jgi:Leucine-rich repeat (LRR) protein
MKKEDLDKWLNDDFNEPDNDRFEKNMMGNLYEYRMTQQLKERLHAQRQKRRFFKWGLWSVLGLLALSFVGYKFVFSSKEKDINNALTEQQIQDSNKELGVTKDTQQAQINAKNILEIEKAKNKQSGEDVPFLPPKLPNIEQNLTKSDKIEIKIPRKPLFQSPIDTEYIYTHSDKDPFLYRSFPTDRADDLTPQDTILDLSKRKYVDVPPSVFLYKKLKKLSLSRNQIETISNDFEQLKELEMLDLGSNKLTTLPIKLSDLKLLTTLILKKNRFKTLPGVLSEMTQLTTLDVSNNKFKTLSSDIGKLTQLRALDVSFNSLTTLPNEIINLNQLTELNLRGNSFSVLPDTLWQMKQLKSLNLGNNRIYSLTEKIGNLDQLETLNLQGNQLTALPEEIEKLTQLTTLDLSDNQLIELPDSIENMKNLKNLILKNTSVSQQNVRDLQLLLPNCRISW